MAVDEQPGTAGTAAAPGPPGTAAPGSPAAPGLDVDPGLLHDSGTRVATAADDARPGLAAATAGDCGSGFPGAAAAAYEALVARWSEQDGELAEGLDALSTRLHTVAGEYVAADQAAAARVGAAAAPTGAGGPALNL